MRMDICIDVHLGIGMDIFI